MRVVLDGRCLGFPLHGIARYTLNLIRHLPLQTTDHLYILYHPAHWQPESLAQVQWVPWTGGNFSPLAQWELWNFLKEVRCSLFHSPSFIIPFALPCPWILTLHDLIHVQRPQDYTWLHQCYFKQLKRFLRRARGILTVSQASAQAIQSWLAPHSLPLVITPLGLESHFISPDLRKITLPYRLPARYWLFVGNPKPHKNFVLLRNLWRQHPDLPPLVAVGIPPHDAEAGMIPLQAVAEAHLPALYHKALGLIAPSLNEGFGLPPLEALACGTRVLVSDLPVFREVLGHHATYFNPLEPEQLLNLLTQPPPVPAAAPDLSAFDWKCTAAETYAFYQRCHAA